MSAFIDGSLVTLIDASLKVIFLALTAGAILFFLRIRNPNAHHRVWLVVLAAMLCLPILIHLSPRVPISSRLVASWPFASPASNSSAVTEVVSSKPSRSADMPYWSMADTPSTLASEPRQAARNDDFTPQSNVAKPLNYTPAGVIRSDALNPPRSGWRTAVFSIYIIGSLIFLFRLALGLWAARKLIAGGRPVNCGCYPTFECEGVRVPLTAGILRPCILLPADWGAWDKELLTSVLQHEQAHIERKDHLVAALAEANRCLYWFHPLAWFLRRKLAALAETTCDGFVVAATGDRNRYAQHLLDVARRMNHTTWRVTAFGVSMARTTQVESRIHAILDATRPLAQRLGWRWIIALVAITAPLILVTAGLRAQEAASSTGETQSVKQVGTAAAGAQPQSVEEAETNGADAQAVVANVNADQDIYGDPLPAGAVSRLGTVRYRHPGWHKRMAFLPDNETFIVAAPDNTVRAWNALSGAQTHEIDLEGRTFQAFCLSSDGRLLATLSQMIDMAIREYQTRLVIWDTSSWREHRRMEWKDSMSDASQQMAFSSDARIIALGARNGTVRLHDVESGQELLREDVVKDEIESLAFAPSGDVIAVAGNRDVVLWEFSGGAEPKPLAGLPRGGQVVRFSPDGSRLAVGSADSHAAQIYDVQTQRLLRQLKGGGESYYREGLCFSADGKQLYVPAGEAHACELFDVESGQLLRSFDAKPIKPRDVAVSKDGRFLACIGSESAIVVWDMRSDERLSDRFIGHLEAPYDIIFTPDDQRLVTGGLDGSIRTWDVATGKPVQTLRHDHWVAGLAVSPGGEWIASCGLDDTVRLWNAATGKELFHLYGHGRTGGNSTTEVIFSTDGKRFFSFGGDMYLRAYDVRNGRTVAEHLIRPTGAETNVDEDGLPRVTNDLFGGLRPGKFSLEQAEFTPDATMLALGGRMGGAIHFFDVETGQELDIFRPEDALQDYAISPDGKYLVTFEQPARTPGEPNSARVRTSSLRIRDLASKQIARQLALPGRYVNQAAFSRDGKLIGVTMSEDAMIRNPKQWISIMETESLREVARLDDIPHSTRAIAFSHDANSLATSFEDSTVLVWDLSKFRKDNAAP